MELISVTLEVFQLTNLGNKCKVSQFSNMLLKDVALEVFKVSKSGHANKFLQSLNIPEKSSIISFTINFIAKSLFLLLVV